MVERILITVCADCALCKDCAADIKEELRRLRIDHKGRIIVVVSECLDECDRPPALKVNGQSISPATPGKLREAVNTQLDS